MAGVGEVTPISRLTSHQSIDRSSSGKAHKEIRRRSRHFTPYQKTPRSRRIKGSASQLRTPPPATQEEQLKDLLNKTWRVYKVSPLFGLKYETKRFRQYSRLLSAHVIAEQNKGEAVNVAECADNAAITVMKGLTLSPDGPDAIRITLKKQGSKGGNNAQVVLTAILCCVQQPSAISMALGFTKLPVMLVKGPVALTRHLISWLQTTFDCCADLMQFSATQLSWMLAMWCGDVLEKRNQQVQFMYTVPSVVEGISKITLDMNPFDCKKLWKSVHEEDSEQFTEEEVSNMIKAIEAHFFYYFKIVLQGMPLSRVGTATMYVGNDGRLKMYSIKHARQVLSHITDLVTEQTFIR